MAEEIKIKISTAADLSGSNAAETGIRKIANVARDVAPQTEKAATSLGKVGEELSRLGSRNNDAKDVLEGVAAAAKGGEGAFFGIAKAARSAWALLSGGPISIAVAGLALIGTAAFTLADKLNKPKKSAEELAKEIEAATKRAEELGRSRLEQLNRDLSDADKRAAAATASMDRLLAAAQRVDNANKAADLAVNRNDKTISEEERVRREFAINDKYAKSEADRQINRLSGNVATAEGTVKSSTQANAGNEVEYRRALAEKDAVKQRKEKLDEIDKQGDQALSISNDAARSARIDELEKQRQALNPDSIEKDLAEADKRLTAATENTQKGRDAVYEAEKKLKEATEILATERDTQAKEQSAQKRKADVNLQAEVVTAKASDQTKGQTIATKKEQMYQLGTQIDAAQAAGDFTTQDNLREEYAKLQAEVEKLSSQQKDIPIRDVTSAVTEYGLRVVETQQSAATAIVELQTQVGSLTGALTGIKALLDGINSQLKSNRQ